MVRTLRFQLRGLEFHSWVGQFHMMYGMAKRKKNHTHTLIMEKNNNK